MIIVEGCPLALPLYALTLFVSAFILFLVQPIIGKIILPKLGGTPQVWNTCMVFFQMVLLAGYAYTHNVSTRFTLRQQLMAHGVLLLLPLIVLLPFPFAFGGLESGHSIWTFVPDLGSNPIPSTLGILFTYVALPFLVVATTKKGNATYVNRMPSVEGIGFDPKSGTNVQMLCPLSRPPKANGKGNSTINGNSSKTPWAISCCRSVNRVLTLCV